MLELSKEDKKRFSDLIRFFSRAVFQGRDFGIGHPLVKPAIDQCYNMLHILLQEKKGIVLFVAEKKIRYQDTILEKENPVVDRLVDYFSAVKLISIGFEAGFTLDDLLKLIQIFSLRYQEVLEQGGVEELARQKEIGHLKVNPIRYELVGEAEKIVAQDAKILDETKERVEKKMREFGGAPPAEDEVLARMMGWIDPSLKPETDQGVFIAKIIEDPQKQVNVIIDAVRLVNKAGEGKEIIASINGKLGLVKDELLKYLREGTDEANEEEYRAAEVLCKELGKQIKGLDVSPELSPVIDEMTAVLTSLMDQSEAQKALSSLFKGEMTLKKKAALVKKMSQRQKASSGFEALIQQLLAVKGMSPQEIGRLFSEKETLLDAVEKEKESDLMQELAPLLEQLADKKMSRQEVLSRLNEVLSDLIDAKARSGSKRLQQEHEKLSSQTALFNDVFGDLDEGVVVFDDGGGVVFVNKAARALVTIQPKGTMGRDLLGMLKALQTNTTLTAEQYIAQNKIGDPAAVAQCKQLMPHLKSVKKSPDGLMYTAIFKPRPPLP